MAYFTLDQLAALIPLSYLTEGLDDSGDGVEDAFTKVREAAEKRINGMLSARYSIASVISAAAADQGVADFLSDAGTLIAAAMVYGRRGVSADQWPFKGEHSSVMARLRAIAKGDEKLAPASVTPAAESASVLISAPANSYTDGLAA